MVFGHAASCRAGIDANMHLTKEVSLWTIVGANQGELSIQLVLRGRVLWYSPFLFKVHHFLLLSFRLISFK